MENSGSKRSFRFCLTSTALISGVKLCLIILVVNLYIVLFHLCIVVLYMLSLS